MVKQLQSGEFGTAQKKKMKNIIWITIILPFTNWRIKPKQMIKQRVSSAGFSYVVACVYVPVPACLPARLTGCMWICEMKIIEINNQQQLQQQ